MSTEQILGLVVGILFGVLLQKARVLRFEKQVAAMQLKDMTILKFMMSAILVGMVGVAILEGADLIALGRKSMNLGGVVIGGILFGIGWAVMGYCPGTAVGALGEGRWHALSGILGMLAGAVLYAELYPYLTGTVLAWRDFGKIGLPETLGVPVWVLIPVFWALFVGVFALFENKRV